MAKGANAKKVIEAKLKEVFQEDFIGVADKKIYVTADDGNGEKVQIAIAMTCPKVPLQTIENGDGVTKNEVPNELTSEDREDVINLMKDLGL